MKRVLLAVLLFSAGLSYTQLPSFSRMYAEDLRFISGEQFEGGGYIFQTAGVYKIVKINQRGNLEWLYNPSTSMVPSGRRLYSPVNSNLIIAALPSSTQQNQIELVALNGAGIVRWNKTINVSYPVSVFKVLKVNENHIIAACFSGGNNIGIVSFDSSGTYLNEQFNSIPGLSSTTGDLVMLPDSTFFASSSWGTYKLDKNGVLTSSLNSVKNIYRLDAAESGYLIGVSTTGLSKIDYDGNLIWFKSINEIKDAVYSPLGFYFTSLLGSMRKYSLEGEVVEEWIPRASSYALSICSDNGLLTGGYKYASKSDEHGVITALDITDPAKNTNISMLTTFKIRWYSSNVSFVHIELSTNGGSTWESIIRFYPSDGEFDWDVPQLNSDSCLIRIKDSYNFSTYTETEQPFSIQFFRPYEYIAANEILMWAANNGDGSHDPNTDGNGFYWPGGINSDGRSAVFEDGLIWGGKINGEVRTNGNTHRQGLQSGNILPDGTPAQTNDTEFRVFKLKKDWQYLPVGIERSKYELNYNEWPAHLGAPFVDNNNDGTYTPGVDQPDYIGDEIMYYVANDLDTNRSRFTWGSDPIGLEFQTSIYAFNDEPLKNVVFKKYLIINKGTYNVTDLFFGYWSDDDLGDANDDFSGVDTNLSMAYTYNGDDNDGIYGSPVPAVGHMILQGPKRESAPDDSAFFKGKWVKGYKNVLATSFVMYIGGDPTYRDPVQGVYSGSLEVYNYLNGKVWNGNNFIDPHTSQPVKFILSGDPVSGIGWYEGPGWPGGKPAGDRRALIGAGPVSMAPGDTQEVVIAIFINQGTDRINSISVLRQDAQYYRDQYYNNFPVAVKNEEGLIPDEFALYQNYPNPFNPSTKIKFSVPAANQVTLKVYDVLGREAAVLINKEMLPGSYEVDFNGAGLSSGVYFYRLEAGGFVSTKKMILLR